MENGGQLHKNLFLSTLGIWNQNWKILVSIYLFIYLFIYYLFIYLFIYLFSWNLSWKNFSNQCGQTEIYKILCLSSCAYFKTMYINVHFLHKNAGFNKIMGSGSYSVHIFQSLFFNVHYRCVKFCTSSISLSRYTGRRQNLPHLKDMHGS